MSMKLPRVALALLFPLALAVLTGCPKKAEPVPTPPPVTEETETVEEPPVVVPKEEGFREEKPRVETKVEPSIAELNRSGVLKPVYFDYDRSLVREDQRAVLLSNAQWLKANPRYIVEIGGHCDERGTTEYNLALGDRRANAIRDYLVGLGVDASRLEVVSYGEERPAIPGSGEETWAQNRRAEFVVLR
jgi:peptidoglycan-associated lipoprotein